MRQLAKVAVRRVVAAAVVIVLAVPFAGASVREQRDPGI